uniref:uncharacterized protein LOC122770804 isoform X1 n=2 Tax=Solea senegalensis TaxID=28829 RepID=UPI001CD8916A|nr:uncharacterized protein LOC122770804 isoform X1 [Solea senegalensis]
MVRMCAFPGCGNKNVSWSPYRFHRIPLRDTDCTKMWLVVMNVAADTPRSALRQLRVCSAHFSEEDYREPRANERDRHVLMTSAVPNSRMQVTLSDMPQETLRSTGNQVNPEMFPRTTEKQTAQYIVDEEAILQLMRNCPACDRKCRCRKFNRRPYFAVYQSCYYCDYQRKWVNQPEAKDTKFQRAPKRKRRPKNKVPLEDDAQSSQPDKCVKPTAHW